MNKIDYQQLEKLINLLYQNCISSSWVLSISNIKSLSELTVVQYNSWLAVLNKLGMVDQDVKDNNKKIFQ